METENQDVVVENVDVEATKETEEAKTFTQEEVEKLLQSETDKRVTSAIKKAQSKWETEYAEKLEVEKSEAEKLAKMSESEKLKAQFDKEKAEFLKEKQTFEKAQLEMQAMKELSSKSLPVEFLNYVVADNAENTKENINNLESVWESALNSAVTERIKGKTPKTSTAINNIGVQTKEEFGKLTYKERVALLEKEPTLLENLK